MTYDRYKVTSQQEENNTWFSQECQLPAVAVHKGAIKLRFSDGEVEIIPL